jgi:hypothetical protein
MTTAKSVATDPAASNGSATLPSNAPEPGAGNAPVPGSDPPPNGHTMQAPQMIEGRPIVDLSASIPQQKGPGRPRGPNYGQPRSHHKQTSGQRSKPREFNPGSEPAPAIDPRDGGPMTRQSKVVDYHAMGVMCVDVVTAVAQQVGGEEWRPQVDEYKNLVNATETYLRAKEFPDLPPGWILCFVVCGYALPRLNAPTTREKLGRVGDKIKGFFRTGKQVR